MYKKFLNKDYKIFRFEKYSVQDYEKFWDFREAMFDEFLDVNGQERFEMFFFNKREGGEMMMEKKYDVIFTNANDKDHVIIATSETELLDYFNKNTPIELFKILKRLNHLQSHGDFRERMNNDFHNMIALKYSFGYKEKLEKIKNREEKIDKLL